MRNLRVMFVSENEIDSALAIYTIDILFCGVSHVQKHIFFIRHSQRSKKIFGKRRGVILRETLGFCEFRSEFFLMQ